MTNSDHSSPVQVYPRNKNKRVWVSGKDQDERVQEEAEEEKEADHGQEIGRSNAALC